MIKRTNITVFILLDLLLLIFSAVICAVIKGYSYTFPFTAYSGDFYGFIFIWFILSYIGNKYSIYREVVLKRGLFRILKVNFFFTALISFLVFLSKMDVSRIFVMGTIFLVTLFEMVFYSIYYLSRFDAEAHPRKVFTLKYLSLVIIDSLLVSAVFLFFVWLKPASRVRVLPQYSNNYLIFIASWLIVSIFSGKFRKIILTRDKFSEVFNTVFWTDVFFGSTLFVFVFALKLIHYSRLIILGTLSGAFIAELLFAFLLFYARKYKTTAELSSDENIQYVPTISDELPETEPVKIKIPERYDPGFAASSQINESILLKLLSKYLNNYRNLFEFINDNVALENVHKANSLVLNTATIFNFENYDADELELFVNIHSINDFRRINKYLIKINEIIRPGGIFIGCGETLLERHDKISRRFPGIPGKVVNLLDFIFNRIFPKITLLKGLYFFLTKGNNRPLSKCEILGRLYYCGFEVINEQVIDNQLFFIAKKVKEPSRDVNPSYSPLFKMKRTGKGGKTIYVYKFRTMHPYAEYLHKYMIETYGYSNKGTGRPANDFRITSWGKFLRKYWLDELPQLINVFKGEMKLIGVRPVSFVRFAEFPIDMQEIRTKDKPGCIPPYVSLLMKDEKQNIEAERIYLAEKAKHPFWTDIKYFFWAVYNILANKIRSE